MPTPAEQRQFFALAKKYNTTAEVYATADRLGDLARRELLGEQTDPDFTPAERRYVSPGHILVEWIGEMSPLAHDQIVAAIRLGIIPEIITKKDGTKVNLHKMLGQANRLTSTRWDGITTRTVTPADGFSRTIRWGSRPGSYIQELTNADADRLFATAVQHEFRYYDDGQWYEFERDPVLLLPPGIQSKVRSIAVVIGNDVERLKGIDAHNPYRGYWA